jgi:hypothetical protein
MSFVRFIEEDVRPGMPLGRHVNHDVRSLGFLHARKDRKLVNKQWPRHIGILDQGDLGSCTGNSGDGNLGTDPLFSALPSNHPVLNEAYAVDLYSAATKVDPYPGQYPPTDTGSDGLSVAQVIKTRGLISGYTHVTDLVSMQDALQDGPVMIGIDWYSSFDTPAADGTITIGRGAYIRGGHEPMLDGVDMTNQVFLAVNSWGDWGVNGHFKIPFDTMQQLLNDQGDCTVLLPLTSAPPVAQPVLKTTDGTLSMLEFSDKYGSPVSTIFRTTLQNFKYFTSGISAYQQRGDFTLPLPANETFCLAWPQYNFS